MLLHKSLLRKGRHDLETLLFDDGHVLAVVEAFQHLDRLLRAVVREEPSWCLWQHGDQGDCRQGEERLQRDGEAPLLAVRDEAEAVVDPVCDGDCCS